MPLALVVLALGLLAMGWALAEIVEAKRPGALQWPVVWICIGALLSGLALAVMFLVERAEARALRDQLAARDEQRARKPGRTDGDLERFAYIASHDLQEPLRKISSFCTLLEEQLKGRLDPEEEAYFGYVTDAAKRMQMLIRDLLALSHVSSEDLRLEPVDCNGLVETVLAGIAPEVERTNARVSYRELPRVHGDREQLTRLFANLIGNAVKFRAAAPPEIVVTAQRIDGGVRFSLSDNGIGFEPRFADRIFRTFQRLHPREDYGGSGIGLAICKAVVERHGGRIWADAAPGKGSTFWFSIPVD